MPPFDPQASPLYWIIDPLSEEPSYLAKPMFGCLACYLYGRLMLVLASSAEEPWNGMLVATDRKHHAELRQKVPALSPHPVLGKWLYVSEDTEDFEAAALSIRELICENSALVGVIGSPKTKPKKKKLSGRGTRPSQRKRKH